jgi:tRNA (cmo5U34)-methyltransferase
MTKTPTIEDFFYVEDASYDHTAERALPHYHEAHRLLVKCIPYDRQDRIEVLDLGVGSGVTSAYILDAFPDARVIGIDLFDQMLGLARHRLERFADRMTFVSSDNTEFLRTSGRQVDAIVSAFCIHHLDEEGKRNLFNAAWRCLRPGGVFLMLDWTTFLSPHLRSASRDHTLAHLEANVSDAAYREKWAYHWNNINIPSPADEMIRWMSEAGLAAETVFRDLEIALLFGARHI